MEGIHIPIEDVKEGDTFTSKHPSGKGGWIAISDAESGREPRTVTVNVRFDDGGANTRVWSEGSYIDIERAESAA